MAKWKACQVDKIPIDTLLVMSVYVGFDMSAKIDLTSVTFVFYKFPFLSGEFDQTGKEIVKYILYSHSFYSEPGKTGPKERQKIKWIMMHGKGWALLQ